MSIEYYIIAQIKKAPEADLILKILEQGKKLGFIYLDFVLAERYDNAPVLVPMEALNRILESSISNNGHGSTYVKLEDTYFHLSFDTISKESSSIFLGSFTYRWEKEFLGGLHIDIARYVRLLLKLLVEFNITTLTTEQM